MSIEKILDIERVEYHANPRQNPKRNDLESNGNNAEAEIFELLAEDDRSGRRNGQLNIKAVKPWEVHDVGGTGFGIAGGYPKAVNAIRTGDNSTYSTDSINDTECNHTIIGLTQAVGGTHTDGHAFNDEGNQYVFLAGEEDEAHLKISYERHLPEVGEEIYLKPDQPKDFVAGDVLDEISYAPIENTVASGRLSITAGFTYFLEVEGRAVHSDGTIIDGNFIVPEGVEANKIACDYALKNTHGINFIDESAEYTNGGKYIKKFVATKDDKIAFWLETGGTLDPDGFEFMDGGFRSSIRIKIRRARKTVKWSDIRVSGNQAHQGLGYTVLGLPADRWQVTAIDAETNRMEIKKTDLLSEDALECYIYAPNHGRWWEHNQNPRHTVDLKISGKSDDLTDFSHIYAVDNEEDNQDVDLFAIQVDCRGLRVSRNGGNFTTVTSLDCFKISTAEIKIGAKETDPHESEVTNNIKKARGVRHFEWLMFNKAIELESILKVMKYLRCKYAYPWDNGEEDVGLWKRCEYIPYFTKPWIETCCFTTYTGVARVPTYVTYKSTTCQIRARHYQTEQTFSPFGIVEVTTSRDSVGNTTLIDTCNPQIGTNITTGKAYTKRTSPTVLQWGPYYYPSVTHNVVGIACPDDPLNLNSRRPRGNWTTTIVDAIGKHSVTKTRYMKPKTLVSGDCDYAKAEHNTFRITSKDGASVSGTKLWARNDVRTDGSESTTGTTSASKYTLLTKKTATKAFGTSWTYDVPINITYTIRTEYTDTFTTKTTLNSQTTTISELIPKTTFDQNGDTAYIAEDFDSSSQTAWTTDVNANTFATSDSSTRSSTDSWYAPASKIGTGSTSSVHYTGESTSFGEMSLTDQTSRWTSISTFTQTEFGTYTTEMRVWLDNTRTFKQKWNLPLYTSTNTELFAYAGLFDRIRALTPKLAIQYMEEWNDDLVRAFTKQHGTSIFSPALNDPRRPLPYKAFYTNNNELKNANNPAMKEAVSRFFNDGIELYYTTRTIQPLVWDMRANNYKTERIAYYGPRSAGNVALGTNFSEVAKFDLAYSEFTRQTRYIDVVQRNNRQQSMEAQFGLNGSHYTANLLARMLGATSTSMVLHTTYAHTTPYGSTRMRVSTVSGQMTWQQIPTSRQIVQATGTIPTGTVGYINYGQDRNKGRDKFGNPISGWQPVVRTAEYTYDPNENYNVYGWSLNQRNFERVIAESDSSALDCAEESRGTVTIDSYVRAPQKFGKDVVNSVQDTYVETTRSGSVYTRSTYSQTRQTTKRSRERSTESYSRTYRVAAQCIQRDGKGGQKIIGCGSTASSTGVKVYDNIRYVKTTYVDTWMRDWSVPTTYTAPRKSWNVLSWSKYC